MGSMYLLQGEGRAYKYTITENVVAGKLITFERKPLMIQCLDKFTNFGLTMSFVADPIIGCFLVVKTINNKLGNSLSSNEYTIIHGEGNGTRFFRILGQFCNETYHINELHKSDQISPNAIGTTAEGCFCDNQGHCGLDEDSNQKLKVYLCKFYKIFGIEIGPKSILDRKFGLNLSIFISLVKFQAATFNNGCSQPNGKLFHVSGKLIGDAKDGKQCEYVATVVVIRKLIISKVQLSNPDMATQCKWRDLGLAYYQWYEFWTIDVKLGYEYRLIFGRESYKQNIRRISFMDRELGESNGRTICKWEKYYFNQIENVIMIREEKELGGCKPSKDNQGGLRSSVLPRTPLRNKVCDVEKCSI
uniref:Uncharacterized protein n=1 Tax=Romanomermis culicivorax TaxID=13658 RepID=A0A915LA26_ROMCU